MVYFFIGGVACEKGGGIFNFYDILSHNVHYGRYIRHTHQSKSLFLLGNL